MHPGLLLLIVWILVMVYAQFCQWAVWRFFGSKNKPLDEIFGKEE